MLESILEFDFITVGGDTYTHLTYLDGDNQTIYLDQNQIVGFKDQ